MLAKDSDEVARIRLLLVDPKARGLGLGGSSPMNASDSPVPPAIRRSRCGRTAISTLRATSMPKAGFKLMRSDKHKSWGKPVVSEHWDLAL